MANVTVKGLDLKGLKNHLKDLIGDKKPGVKVGIMEDTTSADYGPIAPIAAIHEFGAPEAGIKPRPFMRNTVENKKAEWTKQFSTYLKGAIGSVGVEPAFTAVGQVIAADMQEYLESGEVQPGLAKSTVAEKIRLGYTEHASKPLIRTGDLMANIVPQFVDDITKV